MIDGLIGLYGVNDEGDVVGCPVDEECYYESYDDMNGPLLLLALGATAHPQQNARVTEQHY